MGFWLIWGVDEHGFGQNRFRHFYLVSKFIVELLSEFIVHFVASFSLKKMSDFYSYRLQGLSVVSFSLKRFPASASSLKGVGVFSYRLKKIPG